MFTTGQPTNNEDSALSADLFPPSGVEVSAPERTRWKLNPFLDGLRIETRTRSTGELLESETVFNADGEAVETRHYLTSYIDRAEFVKVLSRSYCDLFGLGAAGLRMFWYLCETAQRAPGKSEVYLYWREVIEFKGEARTGDGRGNSTISKSAFYDGLKQLESAGFIARSARPHWYWLNPRRLWNGSRVSFVNTLETDAVQHLDTTARPRVVKPEAKTAERSARRKPRARRGEVAALAARYAEQSAA